MAIRLDDSSSKYNKRYKTTKSILTDQDIKKADVFDKALRNTIKKIENELTSAKLVDKENRKQDSLLVWYKVGSMINDFLLKNVLSKEDKGFFWDSLYGRSEIIHKGNLIHPRRNDYRTASILAKHSYAKLNAAGTWSMWREALTYSGITNDDRIFEWLVNFLAKEKLTRDKTRPILKLVGKRFKRIDTKMLSDQELDQKLNELENICEEHLAQSRLD